MASAVGCRQWLNIPLHVSTIPLGTEVAVVDDVACEVWPRWSFSFIRANRDAIDCRRHCTSWRRFGGGGAETREFISCHTHHPSVTQRFTSILCCSLIDHALRGTPWHSVELEHRFCIRHEYPFNARACSSYTFLQYPSQPLAVHYALSLLISQAHIVQSSCFEHGSSFHASFVPTW